MENASKALIIAGAILLAILIIGLGIIIYNQAALIINNNSMNDVEVSTFNAKFTQYQGDFVKGAQVNALLQQVIISNSNEDNSGRQVAITGGAVVLGENGQSIVTRASTGSTYKVECKYKSGIVNEISVTPTSK